MQRLIYQTNFQLILHYLKLKNVQDAGIDVAQLEQLRIMKKYVQDVWRILRARENPEVLYKFFPYIFIIILVLIDVVAKNYSIEYLEFGQSEPFLPFIDLLLIYNSGIAFGIFDLGEKFFSNIIFIIGMLIVSYLFYLFRNEKIKIKIYSLAMIIAGALGNLIDRAPDGQVTDMFHLSIMNFSFFVFNPADAFISIGAIILIASEFFYKNENS